jgi:hypothetical protein
MIERKIVIGLIVSTEFLKRIYPVWDSLLISSSTGRMLSNWCIDFYKKYKKAPGEEIETIFYKQIELGLDKEIAEEIEEEILPELSEEYVENGIDVDYLHQEALEYLKTEQFRQHSDQIQNIIENGTGSAADRLKEAEEVRANFKPISEDIDESIDLSDPDSIEDVIKAFQQIGNPVVRFPKQLGKFINDSLVPGAFVSLLAPEKRGKTFWLLEFAMRAAKQKKKVAFFQAGDMNKGEQLKRIGVYLCKRNNLEKYTGEHYEPVRDCRRNQTDHCDKEERECNFGLFETVDVEGVSYVIDKEVDVDQLIEAYESNLDYTPCHFCDDYDRYKLGAPWLKKIEKSNPITEKDAIEAHEKFFIKYKRRFKLSTHANGTLSVNNIISILDRWESEDDFVPDIILIDYADILTPSIRAEFRHQQNQIWRELRKLSQTPRQTILPLVIAPTQADANAYSKYRLGLENFSEDKRKFAHVTAMYGLNQDPKGIEKGIGLMRLNQIIIREGAFSSNNEITVLQNLRQGRPFKGSYFQ